MNKVSLVLGVVAVATLAGCKDPNYVRADKSQDEVKTAKTQDVAPEADVKNEEQQQVGEVAEQDPKVAPAEVVPEPPEPKPVVEEETTVYIVQPGDYLSKISKKYNIKIAAIKELNGLKSDVIKVGQKLKLPGKIDVGEQKKPVLVKGDQSSSKRTSSKSNASKKPFTPYTGPTKDYVAVNGDFLGKIAAKHSISVRQLKELNKLTSDKVKIGQKFKVPATAKEDVKDAAPVLEEKPVEKTQIEPVPLKEEKVEDAPIPAGNADGAVDAETVPAQEVQAQEATRLYTVQEGETLNDICANWGQVPDAIRELNNLGENDDVTPGQVIKLPATRE